MAWWHEGQVAGVPGEAGGIVGAGEDELGYDVDAAAHVHAFAFVGSYVVEENDGESVGEVEGAVAFLPVAAAEVLGIEAGKYECAVLSVGGELEPTGL